MENAKEGFSYCAERGCACALRLCVCVGARTGWALSADEPLLGPSVYWGFFRGLVYFLDLVELMFASLRHPPGGQETTPTWTLFLSPDRLLIHAPPEPSLEAEYSTSFVEFAANCGFPPALRILFM